MSENPDYTRNVSLRLSEVLDEIGVNERMVIKRRRLELMNEAIEKKGLQLLRHGDINVYHFGSKVEGTTTIGLESDVDVLFTDTGYKVIQDWSEWEPGKINLLMIQDDTVSPGYCLLQVLRKDAPLPEQNVYKQSRYIDSKGRVLLKNSIPNRTDGYERVRRQGPAHTSDQKPGFCGKDLVLAMTCQQWPLQARQWINQQGESQWPTIDMRQYCKGTGCFVVGVGSKGSVNDELEWRISTSLTERYLMFNLNITQIRCYVLMKMILKTFIATQCPDSISSYMCKTVMFHCISSTNNNTCQWNEKNLLICLNYCLTVLCNCVLNDNCPHFIIPENNLMARRFTPVTKQNILDRLCYIISSNGNALLEIECDQLGNRIQIPFLRLVDEDMSCVISGLVVKQTAYVVNGFIKNLLIKTNKINHIRLLLQTLYKYLMKVTHDMNEGQNKLACSTMGKFFIMHLGSALASINIQSEGGVCREFSYLMSLDINIDVASGKLKLASIFYCTGDFERTELILKNVAESYDLKAVEPICCCYTFQPLNCKSAFNKLCYEAVDEYTLLQSITAFCVRFLRCEVSCCPYELRHEMFRSSQQDLPYRSMDDKWMNLAVIDSLPYLYFLQYKTYSHLRRHRDQQVAISNLAKCILEEPNFGHQETALNLLGQCMEHENRVDAALKFYLSSLKIRGRNNAAKVHICRLISSMLNSGLR